MEMNTLYTISSSFVGGYVAGYLLRKAFSLFLSILGFFLLILIGLEETGIITINWEQLANAILNLLSRFEQFINFLISLGIPFTLGFVLGFNTPSQHFKHTFILRKQKYWLREGRD